MDQSIILPHLPKGVRLTVLPVADSTNRLLTERAKEGQSEDELLIALSQTAGRGRFDRAFYSPDGTGIYMSLLLHPAFSPSLYPLITPLTGVAVAEAIEEISGKAVGIKWVNDIYDGKRKLCGILAEAGFAPSPYLVIGIGINAFMPSSIPAELEGLLGAVFDTAVPLGRERIIAAFLDRFYTHLGCLGKRDFMQEYRRRSILLGKRITVHDAARDTARTGEGKAATCLDIDGEGGLIIRYENGEHAVLRAGEVTLSLR